MTRSKNAASEATANQAAIQDPDSPSTSSAVVDPPAKPRRRGRPSGSSKKISKKEKSDSNLAPESEIESAIESDSKSDSESIPKIDYGTPVLVSQVMPWKRRKNYKEPTPSDQWRPEWKPRKRIPGTGGGKGQARALKVLEEEFGPGLYGLKDLPRDEYGSIAFSPELVELVCVYISQGGTLYTLARALDIPRRLLHEWMTRPETKPLYDAARTQGVDAMVEKAHDIASTPFMVEEEYRSYNGEGELVRKDVKKTDAVYARKLAVNNAMTLASKWAPERYGEKPETKTTESMSQRILAARKRISPPSEEGGDS